MARRAVIPSCATRSRRPGSWLRAGSRRWWSPVTRHRRWRSRSSVVALRRCRSWASSSPVPPQAARQLAADTSVCLRLKERCGAAPISVRSPESCRRRKWPLWRVRCSLRWPKRDGPKARSSRRSRAVTSTRCSGRTRTWTRCCWAARTFPCSPGSWERSRGRRLRSSTPPGRLPKRLRPRCTIAGCSWRRGDRGDVSLMASDGPDRFARVGSHFLGEPFAAGQVELVDLADFVPGRRDDPG
jgi:hypothetical protein